MQCEINASKSTIILKKTLRNQCQNNKSRTFCISIECFLEKMQYSLFEPINLIYTRFSRVEIILVEDDCKKRVSVTALSKR